MIGILLLCPRSGVGPAMLAQRYSKPGTTPMSYIRLLGLLCCRSSDHWVPSRGRSESAALGVCVYNKDMGSVSTVIIMIIVQSTDSPFTIHRLAEYVKS